MSTEYRERPFNCNELQELLPDYLDRTLRDQICEEIKAHLEECEDCRIFVETIETTLILYKHCPRSEVPEEVRIDLRRHLRTAVERKDREESS